MIDFASPSPGPAQAEPRTVQDFLTTQYLPGRNFSNSWEAELEAGVRAFSTWLGRPAMVHDLKADTIDQWEAALKRDGRTAAGRPFGPKALRCLARAILVESADTVSNLGTMVPKLPTNERQARELARLLEEERAEARRQAASPAKADQPLTLTRYFREVYLPSHETGWNCRPKRRQYALAVEDFGRYAGHSPSLERITPAMVRRFRGWLIDQGRARSTANDRARKVRAILRAAAPARFPIHYRRPHHLPTPQVLKDAPPAEPAADLSPAMNLLEFYARHFRPVCHVNAAPNTVREYRSTLKRWAAATGDPPLNEIAAAHLLAFVESFAAGISPNTVRKNLRQLQTILDRTGPRGPKRRDAAGLLTEVPWIKPPREIRRRPRCVSDADLLAIYHAADVATFPVLDDIAAPAWWRALLVVAYNSGLRIGTLLALPMDAIDWQGSRLVIPGELLKGRADLEIPLNATTLEHLRGIQTDRERVFPWSRVRQRGAPGTPLGNTLYRQFDRIQAAAGIPEENRIGFHILRKTAATNLARISPAAAQILLGHRQGATTTTHYLNAELVDEAVKRLPQPGWTAPAG